MPTDGFHVLLGSLGEIIIINIMIITDIVMIITNIIMIIITTIKTYHTLIQHVKADRAVIYRTGKYKEYYYYDYNSC